MCLGCYQFIKIRQESEKQKHYIISSKDTIICCIFVQAMVHMRELSGIYTLMKSMCSQQAINNYNCFIIFLCFAYFSFLFVRESVAIDLRINKISQIPFAVAVPGVYSFESKHLVHFILCRWLIEYTEHYINSVLDVIECCGVSMSIDKIDCWSVDKVGDAMWQLKSSVCNIKCHHQALTLGPLINKIIRKIVAIFCQS